MLNAREFGAGCDLSITGVSYIGRPRNNTAMFCVKKLAGMLAYLEQAERCLVFIEAGMNPPGALRKKHCFVEVEDPTLAYGRLTRRLWAAHSAAEAKRAYTRHPGGYTLGENVTLGQNVLLEPGVVVGHDVVIGDGSVLLMGAKVRSATLGQNCLIKENAVVGCLAYTTYVEEDGSAHRLYNFGRAILGDEVELGACGNICRGSADDTRLANNVKLDDHVYIAHDVQIAQNVRMAASVTVGGYCTVGEGVFIGFGATLRNRIEVGQGTTIGMGSVVTRSVPPRVTAYGNPATLR